jgi:hypothetical protein
MMTNRVDFYQSEVTGLSLPAANTAVHVEGALCPCLEVVEIVRCGWPEFGSVRLRYNPAASVDQDTLSAEQVAAEFDFGKSILISQFYNGTHPGASVFGLPIFTGRITAIETTIDDDEQVEIIARDHSNELERVTVDSDDFDSVEPTHSEAIYTLFCKYFFTGQRRAEMFEMLKSIARAGTCTAADLDGLNVKDAVHRLCDDSGLAYYFMAAMAQNSNGQSVVFYQPGIGRAVELNCQKNGQRLSVSQTDIVKFSSSRRLTTDKRIEENFEVRTLYPAMYYQVGDIVTSNPQSRDLFGVKHDKSRVCVIERVVIDIEKQYTELWISKRGI